jgi:hypothetical protein
MDALLADPVAVAILIAGGMLFLLGLIAIVAPRIDVKDVAQIGRIFVGYKVPPIIVAIARRAVTLLVGMILFRVGPWLGMEELADRTMVGLAAGGIVESAWGLFDQVRKTYQNNYNPPPVAGGDPGAIADAPSPPGTARETVRE